MGVRGGVGWGGVGEAALIPVLHISVTGVAANQMYECLQDL